MLGIRHWLASFREQRQRVLKLGYAYLPRERDWRESAGVRALTEKAYESAEAYKELLRVLATYRPWFERIAMTAPEEEPAPRWLNGSFPGLDAASLYGLLATNNPEFYVEVGAGNSTKFARQAITDHRLRTRIVAIDPYPRLAVEKVCDRIIRQRCEDVDIDFFAKLPGDTVLFVDNTHRSFPNSDVTVFFIEILPVLADGMIWGLHDIFFPLDYPQDWKDRFYNEQYLLMCYLLGGAAKDEILLPNALISSSSTLNPLAGEIFRGSRLDAVEKHGGCFWMKRRRTPPCQSPAL